MSLETDIDALLAREIGPGGPGAAVAVLRDGAFIHRRAYGLADLEWQTPLEPDCVFRIASLTKQFTAVATMMLAERGLVDIDAPIERYLPDWPARGRTVSVRHLLNHTSGVWNHDSQMVERTLRPNPPVAEVLAMIRERPFEFEPGERYAYNNSGYLLLGAIIGAVSGRGYETFLAEEIFGPLGMTTTGILKHETITPKRARGYVRGRKRFHNARLDAMSWSQAAGALGSTLDDLARWDRAIREHRLIRAETFEAMLAPTSFGDGQSYPYGFGWGTAEYRGARLWHHTGGISGFAAHMTHLRDEDLTVIVLSNLYLFPYDRVTRGVIRLVKGWPEPAPALASPTADKLAAFAGPWDAGVEALLNLGGGLAKLATLNESTLCDPADPEAEYRFSVLEDGRYRRFDWVSPLWPVQTFRVKTEEDGVAAVG